MLELLREFGGISFVFDLSDGVDFLNAIVGLPKSQIFEVDLCDRSTGDSIAIKFSIGDDEVIKRGRGLEIFLSNETCEYAAYKLEELVLKGGFSTPEFVQLSYMKYKNKILDTFLILRV